METNKDKEYVRRALKLVINTYKRELKEYNQWKRDCDALGEDDEIPEPPRMSIKTADYVSAIRQLSQIDGLNSPKEVIEVKKIVAKWKN